MNKTSAPRTGVTTGLCAAAAAKAAAEALFSQNTVETVTVSAKNGQAITLETQGFTLSCGAVKCGVKKYSGDDPDVTDGLTVYAEVSKTDADGIITVDGGEGVGRATKPGLKVPVGCAAINPVPMEMIKNAVGEACGKYSYFGGIKVVVSIPGGDAIARSTMNERLGVVGGLSVLGTTGIVEPMSERAILETIKAEIDVLAAAGVKRLLLTPGNYGRDFARDTLSININDAVKCSNYIGETLDHACAKGFDRITLIGHAGKLVKVAGGIMNTHSDTADCRMEIIAAHCALCGAERELAERIMDCVSVEAAVCEMIASGLNERVWESIGKKIGFHLAERAGKTRSLQSEKALPESGGARPAQIEYIVFTNEHGVLARGIC